MLSNSGCFPCNFTCSCEKDKKVFGERLQKIDHYFSNTERESSRRNLAEFALSASVP